MKPGEGDDISARIVVALRDYAKTRLPAEQVARMFAEALGTGDRASELDERSWISVVQWDRLAGAFEEALGPTVTTDALTWSIPRRRDFSAMSLSALATPVTIYKHLDRTRSFFARHLRFEVYPSATGEVRVQLHYRPDVPRTRCSCGVGKGVLQGIPMLFDLPPAEVTELHCWADGAPCCTYDVRFRTEAPLAWIGFVLSGIAAVLGWLVHPSPVWLALPVAGLLLGREAYFTRVRRMMVSVSEEHRRILADNDREFERRYREMRDLNASLEQRVEHRTADLQRAMRELRERNTALRAAMEDMKSLHEDLIEAGAERVLDDQALRELEHEINNPVAFVLANLEHLASEDTPVGDLGELEAAVDDIRLGVDRIRSVVTWFIELHRNAPGPITRFDVASEVKATVRHLERRLGPNLAVDVSGVEDVFVPGRGRQLTQVFVNLLKNAGEALNGRGTVRVTARRSGDRVLVRFEDDGPGIPREVLPRIFERGFSTKSSQNMGLGLHISKQIVERHGGRMAVDSEGERGSRFELDLPAWVDPTRPPPSPRPTRSSHPD